MSEVSLVSEEAVDLAALALRSPSHKPGPPDPDLVAIWKRTARITLEAAAPLMQQQMDLLAWLLAEARWERDQALREIDRANNAWRGIVEQWERGHQDDVLPYTAQLEGEVAALKAEAAEAPEPVTEYGQQMSGGGFHVRVTGPEYERYYPLDQWIEHKVAEGNCWRRRVVVVEDWTEVTEA